jgi:hypothetical protein
MKQLNLFANSAEKSASLNTKRIIIEKEKERFSAIEVNILKSKIKETISKN